MITISGLVLTDEHILVGFIAKKRFATYFVSKETIAKESEKHKIKGGYVRKEFIDGKEHIFVDLDEEITENLISEVNAIKKYGHLR